MLNLLVEVGYPGRTAEQVQPELTPQLREGRDGQVLPHRVAGEQLVHLIAFGEAELANVGDVHACDVATLKYYAT